MPNDTAPGNGGAIDIVDLLLAMNAEIVDFHFNGVYMPQEEIDKINERVRANGKSVEQKEV